ncbi:MAG: sensor histidine kinase N-terminal domain-containing protein [Hyphomicrobiales bacterium]
MNDKQRGVGSLRNQLALTLIGGAAVLAILLFFLIRAYAVQIAQVGQDNILGASVTSILQAANSKNGQIEIDIPYASFSMLRTPSDDRVFYAIYQDDQFLSGYEDLQLVENLRDRESSFASQTFRGDLFRLASATRILVGPNARTKITVVVAQSKDALSGALAAISRNAAIFGVGFFMLAAALSFWATASTIGQLKKLTGAVTRRGPQDLRPFLQSVPSEMTPLVDALNTLVKRLDRALKQSEDFIAEAAHRIRTPLATVRSHAEGTLMRVEKPENRQALRSMVHAIDESSRAATQLLDHAIISFRADQLETKTINLVELVSDLVMQMSPIAEMNDLEFQVSGPDEVSCKCDPILLQNAIRNLLDNAIKYAPDTSIVTLHVGKSSKAFVTVCDEGPGFPPDQLDQLAERFKRGQNAEGKIGSGLGLTIARDVAIAHGGKLELANRSEGGACVSLSL